jgi:hypothetical protein
VCLFILTNLLMGVDIFGGLIKMRWSPLVL